VAAIRSFDQFQIGEEATKGTLVAATTKLLGDGVFTEEQDFYRPNYPRGFRATVGGAGVVTRQGTVITLESDLSPEDILWHSA